MLEMLGNIMDNACKWCRQRVQINCTLHQGRAKLTIADDGPGIDPSQVDLILQRGGRIDQAVPGQGIGLAVVVDIVEAYQGRLSVTHSDLGGAAIALDLPANE